MLRFRDYIQKLQEGYSILQVLLESRLGFLKNQFKGKLSTKHDSLAQHQEPEDIVDHFANNADPTKNKSHTQWILNQYKAGKIRQEDAPRIKKVLGDFERYKPKLEKKDINAYKSVSEIQDSVKPHLGTAVTKAEQSQEAEQKGRTLIHHDEATGTKVYRLENTPEGEKASQNIYGGGSERGGTGTDWCTAARSKDCMFNEYSKKGHLYVIHTKDKDGNEQVHQYHPSTGQFMDRHDQETDMSDFVKKHPEIKNVDEISGSHKSLPLTKTREKQLNDKLESGKVSADETKLAIHHGLIKPEHIDAIVKNSQESHESLVDALRDGKLELNDKHIDAIANTPNSTRAHISLVNAHSEGKLNLQSHQIDAIVNSPNSTRTHNRLADIAGEGRIKLEPHHIDAIVNNPNSTDAHWSLVDAHSRRKIKLQSHHIDAIVNNPNSKYAHKLLVNLHRKGKIKLTDKQKATLRSYGHDIN